jgi:hypothetical protein
MTRVAVLAGAVLLGLAARPAQADIIQYDLTGVNLSGFTGPFVEVTVNRTAANVAQITFDALTNGGYTYLLTDGGSVGINANGASTISGISGTNSKPGGFTPGPYSDGGSGNEDGFGSFSNTINSFDSFTHSATEITFTLTKDSGSWLSAADVLAPNSHVPGEIAAAHIGAYAGNFGTGFAATGFASDTQEVHHFVGTLPAPPSAILLGTGLVLSLLFGLRRRDVLKAA